MLKKFRAIGRVSLMLILCLKVVFATGPSTITSEIVPIAINPAGEVLCKSRYSENSTGSHGFMPTNYGLCLVKNGGIHPIAESDIHFAPSFDAADYDESFGEMEQQFKAASFTKDDPLVEDFYDDLVAEGFQEINLKDYQLPSKFSIHSFNHRWDVDYVQQKQVVLYSEDYPQAYGDYDLDSEFLKTKLLYQINQQIWVEYEDCPLDLSADCDQYDLITPDFYYADYGDDPEEGEDAPAPIPYDWKQKVTSIIFLPESSSMKPASPESSVPELL